MSTSGLSRDHPLAGCDAKLRRAQQNLQVLDDAIGSYLDRHVEPLPGVSEFDPATNRVLWRFRAIEEPDLLLSATVGDYIHDLRSALDHLAFELSFTDSHGLIPNRQIAYPCCRTVKDWEGPRTKGKLGAINHTHRAMIYRTQPCYRRKDAPTNPRTTSRRRRHALADLEDFWNDDKHRTLQPVASAPFQLHGEITAIRDCRPRGNLHIEKAVFGRPLRDGGTVFWMPVRPVGPNPEVEMRFQVGVRITFGNGLPVLETLSSIGRWVAGLVEWFEPVFETPKARQLWGASRGGWIETVPIGLRTAIYRTQR